MSYSKQAEAHREAHLEAQRETQTDDEAPPAYDNAGDESLGESSASRAAAVAAASSSSSPPPVTGAGRQFCPSDEKSSAAIPLAAKSPSQLSPTTSGPSNSTYEPVPTIDSPFNFPATPPAYTKTASSSSSSSSSSITSRPIAIPQTSPSPTSPFLDAYAPLLLSYGITSSSFLSFLSTISAFLTAKVSDRAISHAGDMAKSFTEPHKASFKSVVSHAKAVGKGVGKNAKEGNVIGAALGAVGGSVTIPLSAVGGFIASAASLPGMAIAAAVKKPKTPRQRAEAYIAVANKKWFAARGLYAVLLDSLELADVLQKPVQVITEEASLQDSSIGAQLQSLEAHVEKLEVQEADSKLELGKQTMWLVLSKAVFDEEAGEDGVVSGNTV